MPQFGSKDDFRTFEAEVRSRYRYIRRPKVETFLDAVRDTCKSRLETVQKGWPFWRAQLDHTTESRQYDDLTIIEDAACAPERMKPRQWRGREGRINPKGISCLYGATNPNTAMSEVRPWPGALVSVANFETTTELTIVNCSIGYDKSPHGLLFDENPSPEKIEELIWIQIDRAFSEPVTESDDAPDYVPTQVLAELFKSEGYDGIVYKSRLTDDGFNLALFEQDNARQTYCALYSVKDVRFEFGANAEDEYWIQSDGSCMRQFVASVTGVPLADRK